MKKPISLLLRLGCLIYFGLFSPSSLRASPGIDASTPLTFFASTADELLKAQPEFNSLGLSVTNIPIYPVNSYTPALHRLLQMAANVYDAGTNKTAAAPDDFDYPSVFRPVFRVTDSNTISIRGYVEVGTNADYLTPPLSLMEDLDQIIANIGSTNVVNIYGVPWVIGARKGFPNFNEVSMQSFVDFRRKVVINKGTVTSPRSAWQTNIQYNFGISNAIAVETWNSYASNYPRPVTLLVVDAMRMAITNELGILSPPGVLSNTFTNGGQLAANQWRGFNFKFPQASFNSNSFVVALKVIAPVLSNAVYRTAGFFDSNITFETTFPEYPQPKFGFNITNRMWLAMVDTPSGRMIDYVSFDGMTSRRGMIEELPGSDFFGPAGVWDINRVNHSTNNTVPILGVANQIAVSLGYNTVPPYPTQVDANDWLNSMQSEGGFQSKDAAIAKFMAFYSEPSPDVVNVAMQVPFTPLRKTSVYQTWQANDPLVHYTLPDLSGLGDLSTAPLTNFTRTVYFNILPNIRARNERWMPWTTSVGNPTYGAIIALKDPLIFSSDFWLFPTNHSPTTGWLGQVHRGTPWQTLYLKSRPVDPVLWQNWTGNSDPEDARISEPTNDWRLAGILTRLLSPYDVQKMFSVNDTNLARVMDGMSAITNSLPEAAVGMTASSPQAAAIVAGINATRASMPGGLFVNAGDILASPSLTVQSPWLDSSGQTASEAAYETLPSQLLPWLRPDSFGSLAGNGESMQMRFTGLEGGLYLIEASRDMVDWQPIALDTPTNGTITVSTPVVTNQPGQFFRSRLILNP